MNARKYFRRNIARATVSYVDLCTVYFVAEFHSVDSFRVLDLAYNRKPK